MTVHFVSHLNTQALRSRLIDRLAQEKKTLFEVIQNFDRLGQREISDYQNLCRHLIGSLDAVLSSADWDRSSFLRYRLSSLKKIRNHARQLQNQLAGLLSSHDVHPDKLSENETQLYVSLYQSNGQDLKQWAAQLASISSHMIGRPIYQHEKDIQRAIRQKCVQGSESYAVVKIDRSKIMDASQSQRKDRWGNSLVNVMTDAVQSDQIIEWVHLNKHYHYSNQQLIPSQRGE